MLKIASAERNLNINCYRGNNGLFGITHAIETFFIIRIYPFGFTLKYVILSFKILLIVPSVKIFKVYIVKLEFDDKIYSTFPFFSSFQLYPLALDVAETLHCTLLRTPQFIPNLRFIKHYMMRQNTYLFITMVTLCFH